MLHPFSLSQHNHFTQLTPPLNRQRNWGHVSSDVFPGENGQPKLSKMTRGNGSRRFPRVAFVAFQLADYFQIEASFGIMAITRLNSFGLRFAGNAPRWVCSNILHGVLLGYAPRRTHHCHDVLGQCCPNCYNPTTGLGASFSQEIQVTGLESLCIHQSQPLQY